MPAAKDTTNSDDATPTRLSPADIDWTLPIQEGVKIQALQLYADRSFDDWCQKHCEFCRKFPSGWLIATAGFLDWMNSGRK